MEKGVVKFFNEAKGFGFITPEGKNTDVFVHVSGLVDEIKQDDNVEYEVEEGKRGLVATNVKVID